MISQKEIQERSVIYKREIRRLGFKGDHRPRTPEKRQALIDAAVAFLSTFYWEKGEDGVLRVKYIS